MQKIEVVQEDLTYEFTYDRIADLLKITCKHEYGYEWSTTVEDKVVAKSTNCDTVHLSPYTIYDLVLQYRTGTLNNLITIGFLKHVKGLNISGYFDVPEEYYQVGIPFEIKIASLFDSNTFQDSIILLKADKSITPENINKHRISKFSSDISELNEKYNKSDMQLIEDCKKVTCNYYK